MLSKEPLFEATEIIYEAIDKRINDLIANTSFKCTWIVLVGAILINSDADMGSFTKTKRFDVIDLKSNSRKDYLKEYIL